jgi:hypothetical protein
LGKTWILNIGRKILGTYEVFELGSRSRMGTMPEPGSGNGLDTDYMIRYAFGLHGILGTKLASHSFEPVAQRMGGYHQTRTIRSLIQRLLSDRKSEPTWSCRRPQRGLS